MKNASIKSLILITVAVLSALFLFQSWVLAQTASSFDLVNLKLFASGDTIAYEKIKIVEAWERINQEKISNPAFSFSRVIIGIFDTGIDIIHPEFVGINIDTTLPQDLLSSFFCNKPCGHGTQIAGIIGANNISSIVQYVPPQMNGILSGVKDLPYVLRIRASGDLASFTLKDSFRQFTELDRLARTPSSLHIINSSFGRALCSKLTINQKIFLGKFFSCYDQDTFNKAKDIFTDLVNQYSNILFVFSAGNDGIDAQFNLPGGGISTQNVISVGATNLDDGRAIFSSLEESNFGSSINISAPGEKIYAPTPLGKGNFPSEGGDYQKNFSGTSASAPMVTGVAGLIKAIKPNLSPADIKNILTKTENTDPVITDSDKPIGRRLNALKAVCDPLVGLNCALTTQLPIWPMFQKNAQRTGLSNVAGPPFATSSAVTLKWQKDLGIASDFPPLVGAQAVYVGVGNNLLAFDKTNGNQIWQANIPAGAVNGALGSDGTIYVCGLNTNHQSILTAISPEDGIIKWQFQVGLSRPCNDPAVAQDGTVFTTVPPPFNTQTAVVVAINPDGSQKWRHEEGNTATTPPTLSSDESQVYVGFRENLKAFNTQSGQILWNKSVPVVPILMVVDSQDRVLNQTLNGPVIAFSKSGNFLWQNGFVSSMSLYPGNKIFTANPSGYAFLSASDGSLISFGSWPDGFQLPGHAFPIVDKDGLIYLSLAIFGNPVQVRLFAFDGSGTARWTFDIPSNLNIAAIGGSALNSDGTLYLLAQGLLFAF